MIGRSFRRSIRWRLVASSVLLSLITVAVAGLLAQSLVARAVRDRVADDLRANAEAIAAQAVPLMWVEDEHRTEGPGHPSPLLQDLAWTSSFLADARVTIVDLDGDIVVDSGPHSDGQEFVVMSAGPNQFVAMPEGEDVEAALAVPAELPIPGEIMPADGTRSEVEREGEQEDKEKGIRSRIIVLSGEDALSGPGIIDDNLALAARLGLLDGGGMHVRRFGGAWDHRFDFGVGAIQIEGEMPEGLFLSGTHQSPTMNIETIEIDSASRMFSDSPDRVIVAPEHKKRISIDFGHLRRSQAIGVNVPIGDLESPLGFVRLTGGEAARENALATTRRAFGGAALFASLLAAGLGLVLGHGMSARLRDLTHATGRMSGGDFGARAEVKGEDEIGELAVRFNDMADRLESSFKALGEERDALRHFIADASHELRTPITALRSFNELLAGAASGDHEARAEFVAESAAQIERLAWITDQLLDLSRLEAGLVEVERQPLDVGELLIAAAAAHRPTAEAENVVLEVSVPEPPIEFDGDAARLELALSNLIDNALRHGAERGGRVLVDALLDETEMLHVRVADSGAGIPPQDQKRIFERFERGSAASGTEGSGLGLAIVRSIARAHGGDVSVKPTEADSLGGARFVISLGPAGQTERA